MRGIETLDLNLIRVFNAVMAERNVLRASRQLGLSQSAVSHALNRLRYHLKDELFVRTAAGMQPTRRALEISLPLRHSLLQIASVLQPTQFDPPTAAHSFALAANDDITATLFVDLDRRVAQVAPGVNFVIHPASHIDLAVQIDTGRIDIAIGAFPDIPDRLQSQVLFHQDDVVVCRSDHPVGQRTMALADLAAFPLAVIAMDASRGPVAERGLVRQSEMFDRAALEGAMMAQGLAAQIRVTLPHFMALPTLLLHADMLAIVPRPLATIFCADGRIVSRELPYVVRQVPIRAVWHRRHATNPAHAWMRRLIVDLGSRWSLGDGGEAGDGSGLLAIQTLPPPRRRL